MNVRKHLAKLIVLGGALSLGAYGVVGVAVAPSASATNFCPNPTITDGSGSHTVNGTNGNDIIDAGGGDDHVNGMGGDDFICGGGGADVMSGGVGDDHVYGDAGPDHLYGDSGNDVLYGDTGEDFYGGDIGDDVFGMAGNNSSAVEDAHFGPGADDLQSCDGNQLGGQINIYDGEGYDTDSSGCGTNYYTTAFLFRCADGNNDLGSWDANHATQPDQIYCP